MAKKVLFIGTYERPLTSVRPGAEIVLGIKRAGWEVGVMTKKNTYFSKQFEEEGIEIHPFIHKRKFSLSEIKAIRRVLKERNYDILHVFTNNAVPNAVIACLGLSVKLVTYRGFAGHVLWYKVPSYLSHLNPRVDKITCVSNGVRDQLRAHLLGNKKKAVTVYKGHDKRWYENVQAISLDDIGIPKGSFVVGCIANVRRLKGLIYFLRATYLLNGEKDIHILLLGKGMDNPQFAKVIENSPLAENIHVLGFKEDVLSWIKACDVTVLPSLKGEGLSRVTVESMSLGNPVIATNIGGNPELVINNETGKLIPPRSSEKIAEAILELKKNRKWAKELGQNARRHIQENFNTERTVKDMMRVYQDLTEEEN